jgi:hypothetical protein
MIGVHTIVECNQYLQDNGLKCKVHLRDGCSSQYMWIEFFEELSNDIANQAIIDFFTQKGVRLKFSEDKLTFWEAN